MVPCRTATARAARPAPTTLVIGAALAKSVRGVATAPPV